MFSWIRFTIFCMAITYSVSVSSAFAQSMDAAPQNIMTLQDVLRDTYAHNPTLEAARAELRAVQERLPQAYANFKPTITANAGITAAETEGSNFSFVAIDPPDGSTSKDISLTLDQPVFRGGRSLAQLSAARHIIAAQEAIFHQTQQNVFLDAASVYLDVIRDRSTLDLNLGNRDLIARQLEETQQRFDVGVLTLTDVSQARARLAAAEANVIAARSDLRSSEARFEEIVGYQPRRLAKPNVFIDIPATREAALEIAEGTAPATRAALSVQRAAEEDVDNVFGELLPEIGFTAQWARTYDPQPGTIPEQTDKFVALNANIPLYQAGAVRSRMREAKEISMQRLQEIRETRASVRQQIISNWERLDAARSELEARTAQIEAAALAREGVIEEEQVGERTILDTLNAEQEYLQAQVDEISARRDETVARFSLAAVLGFLTIENIGFVPDKIEQGSYQERINQQILQRDVDR